MTHKRAPLLPAVVFHKVGVGAGLTVLLLLSCGPASVGGGSGGAAGTGGASSSGGALGSGGARGSGGAVGAGGKASGGGTATGAGGTSGSGGSGGTGGDVGGGGGGGRGGRGGASGTGGSAGNAGSAGSAAPGVRIVGRTAPGTTGTRFEWSGSSVSARFMGTQVSAQISDGNNGNSFEIVVDGGVPKKVFTTSGQSTLALATGLTNGMHDLLLWRDTEASVGPTEFIGLTNFGPGGELLPPPPAPDRRIELVGDSFSCGAGIEGTAGCPETASRIENHYLSYGAIAARSVGADLVTIAWSGIGVWRNFGATAASNPSTVMPARYDYPIPTDTTTTWDFSKYQPHVVIMNLNNNDFSTGDPGQPFIDAYLNLARHIRSKYPDAHFIHVIEWRTGNTTDQTAQTAVNRMVTTLRAAGDMKHDVFDMRPYANLNECGGHPDIAAAQAMGNALATELRTVMSW